MLPLLLICSATLLISGVIYYKNYYLRKEGNPVRQQYAELVYLISGSFCTTEEAQGPRNFKIQYTSAGVRHTYLLSEVDNRLIIVWTGESKIQGRLSHEWSFAVGFDQYRMYDEISSDVSAYKGQVLS